MRHPSPRLHFGGEPMADEPRRWIVTEKPDHEYEGWMVAECPECFALVSADAYDNHLRSHGTRPKPRPEP